MILVGVIKLISPASSAAGDGGSCSSAELIVSTPVPLHSEAIYSSKPQIRTENAQKNHTALYFQDYTFLTSKTPLFNPFSFIFTLLPKPHKSPFSIRYQEPRFLPVSPWKVSQPPPKRCRFTLFPPHSLPQSQTK